MGYEGGQQTGKEDGNHYSSDGFRIGKCEAEDNWTACSGGCNDYELGGQCSNSFTGGNCQKDDGMAITITCSQPSTTVFNPSCTGISLHCYYYHCLGVKFYFLSKWI